MSKTDYAVPALGDKVHYYDPKIPGRVGYANGMRGRGAGPYLALVVNDLNGGQQLDLTIFKPMAGGGPENVIDVKGPDVPRPSESFYWDWASPDQKARAEKRRKDAEKAAAEEAADKALA